MTECIPASFAFQPLGRRDVAAAFDGGRITSDAGALLLREVDARFGFLERFAACFTDHRDADRLEHPLVDLLRQRVFGLGLGYEDLNDHDRLRLDPLFAVAVGKRDPLGEDRRQPADRGEPLAGKSTLNRLELTPVGADEDSRYQKTVAHLGRIAGFLGGDEFGGIEPREHAAEGVVRGDAVLKPEEGPQPRQPTLAEGRPLPFSFSLQYWSSVRCDGRDGAADAAGRPTRDSVWINYCIWEGTCGAALDLVSGRLSSSPF